VGGTPIRPPWPIATQDWLALPWPCILQGAGVVLMLDCPGRYRASGKVRGRWPFNGAREIAFQSGRRSLLIQQVPYGCIYSGRTLDQSVWASYSGPLDHACGRPSVVVLELFALRLATGRLYYADGGL